MLKLDASKMFPKSYVLHNTHKDIDMYSSFLNSICFSFCLSSLKSLDSFLLVGSYWPRNISHSGCVNPSSRKELHRQETCKTQQYFSSALRIYRTTCFCVTVGTIARILTCESQVQQHHVCMIWYAFIGMRLKTCFFS